MFSVDFFTSNIASSGKVQVEFKNVNSPANTVTKWFYGETYGSAAISNQENFNFRIYPNPAVKELFISSANHELVNYQITDCNGRSILTGQMMDKIDISTLTSGIYFLTLTDKNAVSRKSFVVR